MVFRICQQEAVYTEDAVVDVEATLFNIAQINCLPVSAQQECTATMKDPVLSRVMQFTKNGLPAIVSDSLQAYFNKHQEITIEGGCLLWGIRVIIPDKLQKRVLKELHTAHPGIVRMKNKVRSHVWWSGLDSDVESLIKSCVPCQSI